MSRTTTQSHARTRRTRAGVTVTALALAVTATGPGVVLAAERYKVKSGDTLASIAEDFGYSGDSAWRRIFDANRNISDPDLIVPGQKLSIPEKGEKVKRRRLPQSATATASRSGGSIRTATASSGAPSGSVWTRLAQCESGGNWAANTGNGYYGGLQFSLSSWRAVGGTGYPHHASAATQIAMGQRLQAQQGWGAWPACSAKLGLS